MNALEVLTAHLGEWVNDVDIIEQAGLGALTELREQRATGTPLRARPHPNGLGLQWRLDQPIPTPAPPTAPERKPFPIERIPSGGYKLREMVCFDCGRTYVMPYSNHAKSDVHRNWVAERQTTMTPITAVPDEPTVPVDNVEHLVFGNVKVCPRCKGALRPERKDTKGNLVPADTFTHDPDDKAGRCSKCRGAGVVQLARG